jgi:hypothetical protein
MTEEWQRSLAGWPDCIEERNKNRNGNRREI